MKQDKNKFRRTDCPLYDSVRKNGQFTAFSKRRNWIWQENATVDFSIVMFQIIYAFCVHRFDIQNHAQPSRFCETECDFVVKLPVSVGLATITKFIYVCENNRLLYLIIELTTKEQDRMCTRIYVL